MAKQYEYETKQGDSLPSKENLNELGKEGWQLVQLMPHPEGGVLLYLMREKKLH